jgi:hypothetical protein
MNFMDAINNLRDGKKLMRPEWSGYYVIILDGQSYIWSIGFGKTQSVNAQIYTASIEDILANDWMVKLKRKGD